MLVLHVRAGVGLATSLLSYAVVEPLATRIMFQRYDLENAPTRDEGALFFASSSWRSLAGAGGGVSCKWACWVGVACTLQTQLACVCAAARALATSEGLSSPEPPARRLPLPSSLATPNPTHVADTFMPAPTPAPLPTPAPPPPPLPAAISKLAKQFGKWHGISSLLNLATLVTGARRCGWRGTPGGRASPGCTWAPASLHRLPRLRLPL